MDWEEESRWALCCGCAVWSRGNLILACCTKKELQNIITQLPVSIAVTWNKRMQNSLCKIVKYLILAERPSENARSLFAQLGFNKTTIT